MSKDKCCGNCKHFKDEDASGKGWCKEQSWVTECSKVCKCHEVDCSGWAEITPDNVDELYEIKEELLMISFKLGDTIHYQRKNRMAATLNTLAKSGGYYYYVLPELKIE